MNTSDDTRQTRETSVGWMIQRLAKRLNDDMGKQLKALDLTVSQFAVMMTVLENGGLSQTEIGKRFDLPAYATTRVLNALEERGFVERQPHPNSRRAHSIHASAAGKKLAKELFSIVKDVNIDFIDPLTGGEAEEFKRLIVKLMMPGAPVAETD